MAFEIRGEVVAKLTSPRTLPRGITPPRGRTFFLMNQGKEEIRMTARRWTMANLAGAAALVLLAGGVKAQAPKTPAPVAAVVNGESITVAEVDTVLKLVPPTPTPPTDAQQRQMRQDALDMLIDDLLVRQFLTANAPKVGQAEFNKEYEALQAGLKARKMALADFLRETNQTEEHLRQDIVKKLQW